LGNTVLQIFFSAVILSSTAQFENWLWAIATHWFLANFFAVASICLLLDQPQKLYKFALSLECGILSMLSMAHGALVLLIGVLVLALQPDNDLGDYPGKTVKILIWTTISTIMTFLYWWGLRNEDHHPPMKLFLTQPVEFFKYVSAYPASILLRDVEEPAFVLGAISCFLFLWMVFATLSRAWRDSKYFWGLVPWIMIGLYAIGTGVVTALGRLGYGWQHALSGRYTTMSTMFFLSFGLLAYTLITDLANRSETSPVRRQIYIGANLFIFALIFFTSWSGVRMLYKFPDFYQKRTHAVEILMKDDDTTKFGIVFPDPQYVAEKKEILKKFRLSFYTGK
jgi:hypothetical protein